MAEGNGSNSQDSQASADLASELRQLINFAFCQATGGRNWTEHERGLIPEADFRRRHVQKSETERHAEIDGHLLRLTELTKACVIYIMQRDKPYFGCTYSLLRINAKQIFRESFVPANASLRQSDFVAAILRESSDRDLRNDNQGLQYAYGIFAGEWERYRQEADEAVRQRRDHDLAQFRNAAGLATEAAPQAALARPALLCQAVPGTS